MQINIFDDDPKYKLHRTGAPATSVAAANSISSSDLKKIVYDAVVASGARGITTKEIRAQHPERAYSSITARPVALEEANLIYYAGDKRDDCRIMRDKSLDKGFRYCTKCQGMLAAFYNHVCQLCK